MEIFAGCCRRHSANQLSTVCAVMASFFWPGPTTTFGKVFVECPIKKHSAKLLFCHYFFLSDLCKCGT